MTNNTIKNLWNTASTRVLEQALGEYIGRDLEGRISLSVSGGDTVSYSVQNPDGSLDIMLVKKDLMNELLQNTPAARP